MNSETVGIGTIIVGLVLVIGAVRGTWGKIWNDVITGTGTGNGPSSGGSSGGSSQPDCNYLTNPGALLNPQCTTQGIPFSYNPMQAQPATGEYVYSGIGA